MCMQFKCISSSLGPKNQHAPAKMTLKNNEKWTQSSKWEAAPSVPDEANKPFLVYLTCLCQLDVILYSTEPKRYQQKTSYDLKTGEHNRYV